MLTLEEFREKTQPLPDDCIDNMYTALKILHPKTLNDSMEFHVASMERLIERFGSKNIMNYLKPGLLSSYSIVDGEGVRWFVIPKNQRKFNQIFRKRAASKFDVILFGPNHNLELIQLPISEFPKFKRAKIDPKVFAFYNYKNAIYSTGDLPKNFHMKSFWAVLRPLCAALKNSEISTADFVQENSSDIGILAEYGFDFIERDGSIFASRRSAS